MKIRVIRVLIFMTCINISLAGSIYLYDLKKDVADSKNAIETWDHCHAVSALQGIVNRQSAELYIRFIESQDTKLNIDDYWLEKYQQDGQWLAQRNIQKIDSLEGLFETFRDRISGVVIYDPKVPATSNAASTVTGVKDLLPVRYDVSEGSLCYLLTKKLQLPVKVWLINQDGTSMFTGKGQIPDTTRSSTGSAKCDVYLWMKENYIDNGLCDCTNAGYYIDYYWATFTSANPNAGIPANHHTLTNHDYFISQKAFFFDLSPWADEPATDDRSQQPGLDRKVLQELLLSAWQQTNGQMIHIGGFPPWAFKYTRHAGGQHGDVDSEWEYTAVISAYNAFQDADAIGYGAMANASFWQHFPLQNEYSQPWVSHEDLRKRGYLTEDGKVDFKGRQFIIFYVGDYDCAAWLYQKTPVVWDNPDRGKLPLMWCISPMIADRAPMAMDYIRKTATANDYFASADNGAGYLNPGMLAGENGRPISNLPSGLDAWSKHCKKYYDQWGLTITGFIIDGFAEGMGIPELDCYQTFSPNGLVWQKGAIACLHHNMPVMRSDMDINQGDPAQAAQMVVDRVANRPIPFHWFRNILKTPSWYVKVNEKVQEINPKIELLDAPTFFELYRIYLQNHPSGTEDK